MLSIKPNTCPRCGDALLAQNISQGPKAGEARGRCSRCNVWIPIQLPSIHKKLLYLDQSFLSAACLRTNSPKSQNEVRLLSKLKKLKERQKIVVVISDVHSRETSAISDQHVAERKKLWRFQNDLADGNIAVDRHDVFVTQQRRILAGQDDSNSFPVTDIGLDDPHWLQVGVRIQLTNHWRPNLDRATARPRDIVNEEFHRLIEQQLENMPSCKGTHDCLNYVRELWYEDTRKGIASWRRQLALRQLMEHIVKELEAGRMPDIPPLEAPAPFHGIVGEVIEGLDEEAALKQWLELLEDDSVNLCASVRIWTAIRAALLWKGHTGPRPINPKKFNTQFGLSRQNDIDHISAFTPYVDALTTDDDMRNLCRDEVVADELEHFPCKIFSTSNYDEFEAWLDILLAEP